MVWFVGFLFCFVFVCWGFFEKTPHPSSFYYTLNSVFILNQFNFEPPIFLTTRMGESPKGIENSFSFLILNVSVFFHVYSLRVVGFNLWLWSVLVCWWWNIWLWSIVRSLTMIMIVGHFSIFNLFVRWLEILRSFSGTGSNQIYFSSNFLETSCVLIYIMLLSDLHLVLLQCG